jgi:DNA-binding CsgD family transcriptional regulator
MKRTYRGWTALELKRLYALRDQGRTVSQIAIELHRSRSSVRNKVSRDEVPLGSTRLEAWWPLVREPHTNKEVAEKTGLSVWAVKSAKQRLRALQYPVSRSGVMKA